MQITARLISLLPRKPHCLAGLPELLGVALEGNAALSRRKPNLSPLDA
jgi:hypothetical protein